MKKCLTAALIALFMSAVYGKECQKLTFDEVYLDYGSYFAYVTGNTAGDTSIPDLLQIDFWNGSGEALSKLETGSYTLTDWESCDTCITLYEDLDENTYSSEKLYAQSSGIFNITEVKEGTKESKGNASFNLAEVDMFYQPVEGGKCYDVENLTWDTICIPDCAGKVCGSDGCSSVCGVCGKNQGCTHDQKKCIPLDVSECTGISIDFSTLKRYYRNTFDTSSEGGIPYVHIAFLLNNDEIDIKPGTYDLGSEKNLSYSTCNEAVKLYSGYDEELGDYTKMYFQHGGTLIVESVEAINQIKGTINVKLVEADIAEDNTTTFFADSPCLEIETAAFDTISSHDPTDPIEPAECSEGMGECVSNKDCDAGYYCGSDCWCYIKNPDEPDTSDPDSGDSGSHDTGDSDVSDSGSGDSSDTATGSGSESRKECTKHTDCDPGYYCERDGKCSECFGGNWGCHSDSDCEFGTRCTDGCWCYLDNLDDTGSSDSGSNDPSDGGSTDSKGSDGCSLLMI